MASLISTPRESETPTQKHVHHVGRRPGAIVIALILGLIALWLIGGGAWLLSLGGSPYYMLAGLGCLIAAMLYVLGSRYAITVYFAVFLGFCIWAIAEVGFETWSLVPRLAGPLVFAIIVSLHWLWARPGYRMLAISTTILSMFLAIGALIAMRHLPVLSSPVTVADTPSGGSVDDWYAFGGTAGGSRYSAATQITPSNVAGLRPAWIYRTGDIPSNDVFPAHMFEVTPTKIGNTLYICTSQSVVIALDPDTGLQRWRFDPYASAEGVKLAACRGVSYFKAPSGTQDCPRRIIVATRDGHLFALDAATGRRCSNFGNNGQVSLLSGMGQTSPGFVYPTSPPAIANGTIVVGGFVLDGYSTKEPAGVVRGYDAMTGVLRWAWDPGAADENPKPGVPYSRGSPNSWSVMSADPSLGLVYVPTGNATPDFVNQHRSKYDNRYSSSVVALDAGSGVRRWSFQTTHQDLWDYDVGSQPVLFNMPMPGGGTVPALAQPTKHGEIFILDRRNGKPLTRVLERAVPQGSVPNETYSPTQPYSVDFPSLSPPPLHEKDMWGATPLDQLWCRIQFRSLDYRGKFTPPSVRGSLQYPGTFGMIDWGSVAIDEARKLMIVNSSNLPTVVKLLPRRNVPYNKKPTGLEAYSLQLGTGYAVDPEPFLSPLGLPCIAPPWGRLTAIDLTARKQVWQRSLGTSKDLAPLGIAVPGAFNLGGSVTTASGLTFISATIDNYLRAFETRSGRELWRGRLPAGGQAGAMTYVSGKTGRQYVVIAAGGHQFLQTGLGDYLVAYALPVTAKGP